MSDALVQLHPRAFRACKFLARAAQFCLYATVFGPLLLMCSLFICYFGAEEISKAAILLGVLDVVIFFGLAMIFVLLRSAIVAVFFAQYSLMHLVGVVLVINFLATLFFLLPHPANVIPVIAGAWVVMVVVFFLVGQDPTDPRQRPPFIQETLAKARRL